MNILYLSCHSILEWDECKLLSGLGYTVRAIGSYTNPHSPGDPKRPPIPSMEVNLQHIDISNRFHQDNLHQEHLDWADVIIFMHQPDWIYGQIDKLNTWNKSVIFRSIGQSSPDVELKLNHLKTTIPKLKIVKYSNKELLFPNNAGADAIIPFYKDIPYRWKLDTCFFDVAFCMQSALQRGNWTKFNDLFSVVQQAEINNTVLFGPGNEPLADQIAIQCPDYEGLVWGLSKSKILFYAGTIPASYTLTPLEAMFIGTPIITISDEWWRTGHDNWVPKGLFEVCDWIPDETCVDKTDAVEMLKRLLANPEWLETISLDNRAFVEKNYSKKVVGAQWSNFLETLVG